MAFVAFPPPPGTQTRARGKYKWWRVRGDGLEKLESCVRYGKGDLRTGEGIGSFNLQ